MIARQTLSNVMEEGRQQQFVETAHLVGDLPAPVDSTLSEVDDIGDRGPEMSVDRVLVKGSHLGETAKVTQFRQRAGEPPSLPEPE
jgi:hypothetical protein